MGTSPFVGAGQFGVKSYVYYRHFYKNPRNITKIVLKAADLGISGIHALPYQPIFWSLKAAEKELGEKFTIIGTIGPDNPLEDLKNFHNFNTVALLLHGELADKRNQKVGELLNNIHDAGYLAGLATHSPSSTLSWLCNSDLDIDLVMVPFNRLGMFMDDTSEKIVELIKLLGKPVIGKKVLAAGRIQPRDALEFVLESGCIDFVALGVASEREAEETFGIAAELFSEFHAHNRI